MFRDRTPCLCLAPIVLIGGVVFAGGLAEKAVAQQTESVAYLDDAVLADDATLVDDTVLADDIGCFEETCESCSAWEFGGWLSSGIFSNAHGAANNGPLGFNQISNGYNLDQLWFHAEKVADTGGCGIDWGFRADFIFGVDGPGTQAFGGRGWDTKWNTSSQYGSALPQLYAELAIDDLTIQLGHFYTIIGWEVVPDPDNFFYTHSYTMYYGEPFTHTGVLASYQVNDDVTIHGGWTQGWDTGFDNTPKANTFLGGITIPFTQDGTLTWACSAGDMGVDAGNIYMNSIVYQVCLTDQWTYILQHDLGTVTNLGADNNKWYGINQYLQYQINDCWAAGVRVEWFDDPEGARISQNGLAEGSYYELTAGVNWKPNENVTFRPEIRYDWFTGTAADGELPFNEGRSSTQFSGGFDCIFSF